MNIFHWQTMFSARISVNAYSELWKRNANWSSWGRVSELLATNQLCSWLPGMGQHPCDGQISAQKAPSCTRAEVPQGNVLRGRNFSSGERKDELPHLGQSHLIRRAWLVQGEAYPREHSETVSLAWWWQQGVVWGYLHRHVCISCAT